MASVRRPCYTQGWEEDECLEYYGMFSLHQMFEVIGTHLTEIDMEVLSFLLEETHPFTHPLDPELWTVEDEDDDDDIAERRSQEPLVAAWQRRTRCALQGRDRPVSEYLDVNVPNQKNGVEFLLELERRGKCGEENFTRILQLLRVLTRHDLFQYVTMKRPRTVSPERFTYGPAVNYAEQKVGGCLNSSNAQENNGDTGTVSSKRTRLNRGRAGEATCRRRGRKVRAARNEKLEKNKVTCVKIDIGKA